MGSRLSNQLEIELRREMFWLKLNRELSSVR
jgi:hypothetical protein